MKNKWSMEYVRFDDNTSEVQKETGTFSELLDFVETNLKDILVLHCERKPPAGKNNGGSYVN